MSRRGRVLVVAPQPFYEDRGTPIAILQVIEALVDVGFEVDLLTFPVGRTVTLPGLRLHRAANPFRIRSVPIGLSVRKLVLDATLVASLQRLLRRERYDCVHAVEEAAFPAAVLARRRGIPVIYDMQSSLPEQLAGRAMFRFGPVQRFLRRCERWLLRNVDLVMSSSGLAERVRQQNPAVPIREWAYFSEFPPPPGSDVATLREELDIPSGARVIVYTGTFEEYQGLGTLLQALRTVRDRADDVVAVLAGADGPAAETVMQKARALGVDAAVRVVGRRPRDRIPAYLAMADVLVSPRAFGGNLPLKIFDYLAAGRPIVATDIPTHRSVLNEERAVLVPFDANLLADGLLAVLENPTWARQLGRAGRRYARNHLGRRTFVQSIGAIYGAVTGPPGRPPTRVNGSPPSAVASPTRP